MRFPIGTDQTIASWGPRLQPGQKVFGERFLLDRCLENDPSGEVWLAGDVELGGKRELKFLPEEVSSDPSSVAQLKRQAVAGRRLTHPRIVRVDEFHAEGELVAVSREHVEGNSLADGIEAEPRKHFEVADIKGWVADSCEALEYAHAEAKVVHRDLRPEQVLIDAASGRAKVADFGLSKRILETRSRLTGRQDEQSLPYGSPQVLMGERGTPSDDLYALGALIYHLLTGRPPFWRGDVTAQILNAAPLRMAERRREFVAGGAYDASGVEIPEAWERAVAACLEKEVARRPADVKSFRQVLKGSDASPKKPVPDFSTPSSATPTWENASPVMGRQPLPVPAPKAADPLPQPKPVPVDRENRKPAPQQATEKSRTGWIVGGAVAALLVAVLWWNLSGSETGTPKPSDGNSSSSIASLDEEKRQLAEERKRLEQEKKEAARLKQEAEQAAAAASTETKRKEEQRKLRERQAKQVVSDYLSACDRADAPSLRRYLSSNVSYLNTRGGDAAVAEITSYANKFATRKSTMSQSDMTVEMLWGGDRAKVTGWMDFSHGGDLVTFKGRVRNEFGISWDSSGDPQIESVRELQRSGTSTVFDQAEQKKQLETLLRDYYNAGIWSGGNVDVPDQIRYLSPDVRYFDFKGREEARKDLRRYREALRSKGESVFFGGWKGSLRNLGSEAVTVELEIDCTKTSRDGSRNTFKIKNRVVVAFRKENGWKPWIESIRQM